MHFFSVKLLPHMESNHVCPIFKVMISLIQSGLLGTNR